MKALTLTQPWATLVAIGAKRVETRSWGSSYRGPLAIHAAKSMPRWAREAAYADPIGEILNREGLLLGGDCRALPRGAVVAVADLTDVLPTEQVHRPGRPDWDEPEPHRWADGSVTLGWTELELGDYSPGRYAWILEEVNSFDSEGPVPAKGALGLWEWDERPSLRGEV